MLWWFLILAVGAVAVLWAGIAAYFRVQRHMKAAASRKAHAEREPDTI